MDIFETFATDANLETEGVWHAIGQTKDGKKSEIRVARANNEAYMERFRSLVEANKEALDAGGKAADQLAENLVLTAMSETILKGWKNLSYQGKTVEYSHEMAFTLLRVKDFRIKVSKLADNMAHYKAKSEAAQGND